MSDITTASTELTKDQANILSSILHIFLKILKNLITQIVMRFSSIQP